MGLALVAGLAVPSAAAGEHRARMSGELTRKLAAKDGRALQVILTAPQAEVDRLSAKFKLNVSRRLASGAVFTGTGAQISALAGDTNVKVLVENRKIYATNDVSTQSTGANQLWAGENGSFDGITGRGVGVVVMDSGIARHQDLANRVRVRFDFTGTQGKWRFGGDDHYGHGTHVAGIIAGSGKGSLSDDDDDATSTPFIGMAPGAALISMKVLGPDGSGYVADVIDAIDFSIRFKNWLGIRVINLSLGHPASDAYRDDPLAQAVERAVAAGIVVVAAAGNMGQNAQGVPIVGAIISPGFTPGALTVGILDTKRTVVRSDDDVNRHSSRGPVVDPGTPAPATPNDLPANTLLKPELVAPGVAIISPVPSGSLLWQSHPARRVTGSDGGTYLKLSGSSMSTAMASGAAALLLQAKPSLTPNQVKTALQVSASFIPNIGLIAQGAGSLNAALAVRSRPERAQDRGGG